MYIFFSHLSNASIIWLLLLQKENKSRDIHENTHYRRVLWRQLDVFFAMVEIAKRKQNTQYSILPVWELCKESLFLSLQSSSSEVFCKATTEHENHSWLRNFGNNFMKGLKLFATQVIPTVFGECLSLEHPCPLHSFIVSSFITCLYSTTSSYIYKQKTSHS